MSRGASALNGFAHPYLAVYAGLRRRVLMFAIAITLPLMLPGLTGRWSLRRAAAQAERYKEQAQQRIQERGGQNRRAGIPGVAPHDVGRD